MPRPILTLPLVAMLVACATKRPSPDLKSTDASQQPSAATAGTNPAADIDMGPVDTWYRSHPEVVELNPAAAADDLSFAMNLIAWVVAGEEAAWQRMAPRVEAAFAGTAPALKPAFQGDHRTEAAAYHQAAAPLSQKPRAERDPALEARLYAKAVLLDPANADLYDHLAIAASIAENYVAAERWAKLAIAIDPTFLAAYQELSYIYKNTERYREAVALVDRAVNIDGDIHTKAMLLARKGQALWFLKEEEAALGAFRTAKRLGGPAWVESYLKGEQKLGQPFEEPPAAAPAK